MDSLKFKAGLLNRSGNSFTPDLRKGELSLRMEGDEQYSVLWSQRPINPSDPPLVLGSCGADMVLDTFSAGGDGCLVLRGLVGVQVTAVYLWSQVCFF